MKFLTSALFKTSLCAALRVPVYVPHRCTRVYAASSASSALPPVYRESPGRLPGRASKEGLGSPQKLICNFNIPLFIPAKSVGGRTGFHETKVTLLAAGVALHRTCVYRRNCLVMVGDATAADPEFVGRAPLNNPQ